MSNKTTMSLTELMSLSATTKQTANAESYEATGNRTLQEMYEKKFEMNPLLLAQLFVGLDNASEIAEELSHTHSELSNEEFNEMLPSLLIEHGLKNGTGKLESALKFGTSHTLHGNELAFDSKGLCVVKCPTLFVKGQVTNLTDTPNTTVRPVKTLMWPNDNSNVIVLCAVQTTSGDAVINWNLSITADLGGNIKSVEKFMLTPSGFVDIEDQLTLELPSLEGISGVVNSFGKSANDIKRKTQSRQRPYIPFKSL